MKAKIFKKRSYTFGSVIKFIALFVVLSTMATTYLPLFFLAKQNIRDTAQLANEQTGEKTAAIIDGYFTEVESMLLNMKVFLDRNPDFFLINSEYTRNLFLDFVQRYPYVSWISFGFTNGDFAGVQRTQAGEINYVIDNYVAKNSKIQNRLTYSYGSEESLNFSKISTPIPRKSISEYFSPSRPWYKLGVESSGMPVWTDVYVFRTSQKPGVNVAIPYEKNGQHLGVLTVAMELNQISNFLAELQVGKTGTIFILDKDLHVVSAKEQRSLVQYKANQLALKNVSSFSDFGSIVDDFFAKNQTSINENDLLRKSQSFFYHHAKDNKKYFISLSKITSHDWYVATLIPEDDFLGDVNKENRNILIYTLLAIVFILIVVHFLNRRLLVEPLEMIYESAESLRRFEIDKIRAKNSSIVEIENLGNALVTMKKSIYSFSKYLPNQMIQDIVQGHIESKVGGKKKVVTILFTDIAGFTKISERLGADLPILMESYFGHMATIIVNHNGNIDKYIGDAIMAFWNAPMDNPNHASDACLSVIECLKKLKILQKVWADQNLPMLNTRFGVNTGEVIVGNIGSDFKMDYTVLGDSVNLASRLEALNKFYGTNLLISEHTYEASKESIITRKLDCVRVYGKEESTTIYELIDSAENINFISVDWITQYESAFALYQLGKFEEAEHHFRTVLKMRPNGDPASDLMILRCQEYQQNPRLDFDGVFTLGSK